MQKLRSFFTREDGATAVEYGIMVALIAVAIIAAVTFLGDSLCDTFDESGDAIAGNTTATNSC